MWSRNSRSSAVRPRQHPRRLHPSKSTRSLPHRPWSPSKTSWRKRRTGCVVSTQARRTSVKARNTEQTNTHSSLYWLVRNLAGPTRESMRAFFGRHKRTILITLALILTGVVIFRPIVHPFVILVRAYLGRSE